jgi:hypothetical protein
MKLIIPKQAKVKRLLNLQHNAQVPEKEDQKSMNPSNPLQTQPEIGNDGIMQPLQSVQMPIIKIKILFVLH